MIFWSEEYEFIRNASKRYGRITYITTTYFYIKECVAEGTKRFISSEGGRLLSLISSQFRAALT